MPDAPSDAIWKLLDINWKNERSCISPRFPRPSRRPLVDRQVTSPIGSAEVPTQTQPWFQTLYAELHRLARCELARRGSDLSIGVTSLLHEAWLNMAAHEHRIAFPDRSRFMAYAAQVMRRLIVDYARNRHALKRGGAFEITSLDTDGAENLANASELQKISEALDELAQVDPSLAEVVDLKFFCGFTLENIAEIKGISERTVRRHWEKARLYLYETIRSDPSMS